ncbi:DUF4347 domain-containing protein [Allocoleopsis franciscana]|uniref:Lectin C-type domain protein n=1 Tax=Allocoleopsis franciscana PCC 7113 TaxID=1173027 RepID=K9WM68_9CYAN|nr:DUF4347 domain-containing protein [Allocoleopsis franciscana]AFZ20607.1 Lectin C-type domain protein [Allocoleopsis franciscana PCC 7113]
MKSTLDLTPKTSNQVATVVFVDAGVGNYQQLVNGVISKAEVLVLDAAADGIEQISQVLQQRQDVGVVHLVSHGAPGCLYLGNTQLSLDTFNRYATQLQQWNVTNLLLYGCYVAAGDAGEEFVEKLHQLTGANIAASRTPTGNSALGGNWELEVVLGQEPPLLAFLPSVMAAYEGILNTGTPPILSVGGTAQYTNSPVAVASSLTITDPDVGDTIDGASVEINGQVTGQESLSIAGQAGTSGSISGINWSYDATSGVMKLLGTATVSTYESVLRQVTYQNTSATPTTAPRDIQFSLGTALFNRFNGHYYEFVSGNLTWEQARTAAASRTNLGLQGYLATITSQPENDFIANKLEGNGWMGASDAAVEGEWRWVTGPEAGTLFWQGNGQTGSAVPGQYNNWSTTYQGGTSIEPNDNGGNEDYAHFLSDSQFPQEQGKWNDYPVTFGDIQGYLVEYDPAPNLTGTATVTFSPTPANPTPGQNPGATQSSNWDFVTRDYNRDNATDVVAIKKSGTGTAKTEVHIMNRASNYKSWLLQTGTVLHETDAKWDFVAGDCNRDAATDILSIKKSSTGSSKTEVHIMDAATNYQTWVVQTATVLHETDNAWDFVAGDYNRDGVTDLIGIKKSETGSKSTEIHIMNGATNYKTWLKQTGTALEQTGDNFDFQAGDYNRDGVLDLFCIKKSETGSKSTEVHVLNGASNFQSFILQTKTVLEETKTGWDFLMDDYTSSNPIGIISLKESNTGTNTTEAHIFNGGVNYQGFSLQTGSILPEIAASSIV